MVDAGFFHVCQLAFQRVLTFGVVEVHIAFRLFDDQLAQRFAFNLLHPGVDPVLFRHAIQKCIQQFGVREQVAWQPVHVGIDNFTHAFFPFVFGVMLVCMGLFLFGGKNGLIFTGRYAPSGPSPREASTSQFTFSRRSSS